MSIDALCNLPPHIPNVDPGSVILTGSSDGYVRAVQLFPTNLLGVVTDHGEWPVERIAVGEGRGLLTIRQKGSEKDTKRQNIHRHGNDEDEEEEDSHVHGPCWVGSVGHEEVLRMSNLDAFFRKDEGKINDSDNDLDAGEEGVLNTEANGEGSVPDKEKEEDKPVVNEASDSDDGPEVRNTKKRKRKQEKDPLRIKKRKGKNELEVDTAFFGDL
ncbi:hypothetical protein AX15_000224 [Amanita polypyramis BW_CC]|nr:hypothetical protein AX15_000224 [Amanita polypyramis BW_CC]